MNDISTNLSKLNIFQKMKLRIWQNSNKINLKSYSKQPQYIKYDETIIQKIVKDFYYNKISEEELFFIPINKLVEHLSCMEFKGFDLNNSINEEKLSAESLVKILRL